MEGFLHFGRCHPDLIAIGLISGFLNIFTNFKEVLKQVQHAPEA